jgi:hypothetical protein
LVEITEWGDNYSAMRWPCSEWYHIPLKDEWVSVKNIWNSISGKSSSTDFWLDFKMPFSWNRFHGTWDVANQWVKGWYWSSSVFKSGSSYWAYMLNFETGYQISPNSWNYQAHWQPIRPFKDVPVVPTQSWTKIYWTSIESWWIYWSSTDWLISLSSDWTNWITMSDKNLWATTVWNSWDTLSEANCWKYYQWWNNYWFPFTWSVTTSSTLVNAGNYWPWNYYSSSTFITTSTNPIIWSSVQNDNLRWWETWVIHTYDTFEAWWKELAWKEYVDDMVWDIETLLANI